MAFGFLRRKDKAAAPAAEEKTAEAPAQEGAAVGRLTIRGQD